MKSSNSQPGQEPRLCRLCGASLAGHHHKTLYCAPCGLVQARTQAALYEHNRPPRQRHRNLTMSLHQRTLAAGTACPHLGAGEYYHYPNSRELGGKILEEFIYEDEYGHLYRRCRKCYEQELGYLAI